VASSSFLCVLLFRQMEAVTKHETRGEWSIGEVGGVFFFFFFVCLYLTSGSLFGHGTRYSIYGQSTIRRWGWGRGRVYIWLMRLYGKCVLSIAGEAGVGVSVRVCVSV
jgi:hypothetical protein